MKALNVSQFREQCLNLLDSLPAEGVVITKRGRPLARLVPVATSCADFIGSIKDLSVDPSDDLLSTGAAWDAQS